MAAAAALLASACSENVYRPEFLTRSPDGRRALLVSRNRAARDSDYFYWIELRQDGRPMYLARHDEPATLELAEVNWSAGGSIVRLFYCEGSKPATFGFDFVKLRTMSPHEILPFLIPQIQRRYGLPPGTDVANWACSTEGRALYRSARR